MGTCTRAFCIFVYTEVILLDSIVSHSVVGYYYNEVVLSKKLRTAVFHDSSLSLVWRKVATSQVARCLSTGALFVSKNYLIPVAVVPSEYAFGLRSIVPAQNVVDFAWAI